VIPREQRRRIAEEAQYRCGYCQTQEVVSGIPLTIEHLTPKAKGGSDDNENLWLSCRLCNEKVRRENGNDDSRLKRGRLTEGAHLQGNRLTWRRKPKGTIACR